MVKISNRLMTAAALVTQGYTLADVGTDHGYIPIYLLQQKKIPAAIAMDINEGPLERAKEHIALYGLQAYIQTRLSDGVAALKPGEVDKAAELGFGQVQHRVFEESVGNASLYRVALGIKDALPGVPLEPQSTRAVKGLRLL